MIVLSQLESQLKYNILTGWGDACCHLICSAWIYTRCGWHGNQMAASHTLLISGSYICLVECGMCFGTRRGKGKVNSDEYENMLFDSIQSLELCVCSSSELLNSLQFDFHLVHNHQIETCLRKQQSMFVCSFQYVC